MADGLSLLLTPFQRMIVPPPMSACSLTLSAPVRSLSLGDEGHPWHGAALLSDSSIVLFNVDPVDCDKVKQGTNVDRAEE